MNDDPQLGFDDVLRDFHALKQGLGLTPDKMRQARAVLATMGELHPVPATQRLLDDLADLTDEEGAALAWALRANPATHTSQTLDGRRLASGIPENTAKDRERRAVKLLYDKWIQRRQDWATSVFETRVLALPVELMLRFGSMKVTLRAYHDNERACDVVAFEVHRRAADTDFLSVASDSTAGQALAIYGTSEMHWRLGVWLPAFQGEQVLIHRAHPGEKPSQIMIERTLADGRAIAETIPAEQLDESVAIGLPTSELTTPCPITWSWSPPPPDSRPAIVFPDADPPAPI